MASGDEVSGTSTSSSTIPESDPKPWQPPLFESSTWILIISALVLLFAYDNWRHNYWQRRGISTSLGKPFVGHMLGFFLNKKGMNDFITKHFQKFGKNTGFYMGWRPVLLTADVDVVRQVCIKDFTAFVNRMRPTLDNKPFNRSLTALRDNHWRDVRGVISPMFSGSKMKMILPFINVCAGRMVQKVAKCHEEGKYVQLDDVYGGFLLEAIGSCAFGLDITAEGTEDTQFLTHAKDLFKVKLTLGLIIMLFVPFLIPVGNYFNLTTFDKKTMGFFINLVDQAIEMRKIKENQRNDFLQMMLDIEEETEADLSEGTEVEQEHRKKTNKRSLSREEIMSQALVFFLAGFASSGSTLGFASYLLATNPDIQDRLLAEVDEIAPQGSEVKYDIMSKMTYLDQVICEVLRLYPAATLISRLASKNWEFKDYKIEAGTEVFYSVWDIHRDKDLWEDPDTFNPERFSPEKKKQHHPCAWLPFGVGPRNCIGLRFALLQVKLCLVHMLQNFRFETCSDTEIPPVLGTFGQTTPPNGFKLNAVPRS